MAMLWTQHRERYAVAGYTARRLTYYDYRRITASMTAEDMAAIGRLNAKRQSGAVLDQAETDRLAELASRWPMDELRGACLQPPVSAQGIRDILDTLPRRDSEELEAVLERCMVPDFEDGLGDELAVRLILTGGLAIDPADMTVAQGHAVLAILAPKEG